MTAMKLITAPTVEPVTLAEAKLHLRIEDAVTAEDALISALIATARHWCEAFLRRAIVTQTWDFFYDCWPWMSRRFVVPLPPAQTLTGVYYTIQGEAEAQLTTVALDQTGEAVYLSYGEAFPSGALAAANPIRIRAVCGYGLAAAVPPPIKLAILLLVAQWYQHRENVTEKALVELPMAAKHLLWPLRSFG
jgi:uncharacterized phiE125 gp8 family phage protein